MMVPRYNEVDRVCLYGEIVRDRLNMFFLTEKNHGVMDIVVLPSPVSVSITPQNRLLNRSFLQSDSRGSDLATTQHSGIEEWSWSLGRVRWSGWIPTPYMDHLIHSQ